MQNVSQSPTPISVDDYTEELQDTYGAIIKGMVGNAAMLSAANKVLREQNQQLNDEVEALRGQLGLSQ